jgi:hypothetical protein
MQPKDEYAARDGENAGPDNEKATRDSENRCMSPTECFPIQRPVSNGFILEQVCAPRRETLIARPRSEACPGLSRPGSVLKIYTSSHLIMEIAKRADDTPVTRNLGDQMSNKRKNEEMIEPSARDQKVSTAFRAFKPMRATAKRFE